MKSQRTKRTKKKEPVYKSMEEFEKAFFPESFRGRLAQAPDPQVIAARMADEALDKLRHQLAK